ncbi:MAG TPA: pilus assembly protein PilM [Syntrophorhabdaceae bacterium]|nr:pilus assembly protein PilM [Syntrophorhabdaceae bacterium]HQM81770.1 pilus assembly protein PilM [Syntrophorhabdaceae bacterium]
MDILAVDIGTVSVKYVKVGNGSAVSSGVYTYKGSFDDLEMILGDIKIKEGNDVEVVIGISSQEITKKAFTIPILPKKEQKDVLNWSTTKILTTPLDDMIYEHIMLGAIDEKGVNKDEVLFVGAPKHYINSLISVFERVGLNDVSIIADIAFAYVNAIGETGDASTAIVDVGGRRTGLYVANAKRLMFAREILTASESFSDALMSGPGLSYDQAEQYKREKGFDEELTEILRLPFERLEGEVLRTLSVYNQRYPDKPVSKLFITGRGSKIPGFLEKMKESFVEEVSSLEDVPGIAAEYIPAYTLAVKRDGLPNLLPERLLQKGRERSYKNLVMMGSIGVVVILILLSFMMWGMLSNANLKFNLEKGNLDKLKEGVKQLTAPVQAGISDSEILMVKNEIRKKDLTFVTLLKFLSSKMPRDVYLTSIEFGEDAPSPPAAGGQAPAQVLPPPIPVGQGVPVPKVAPGSPAQTAAKIPDYPLVLKGYIMGEQDGLELTLFDLMLNLKRSGFVKDVELSKKEMKPLKGKQVMEFIITSRCMRYEL